MKLAGAEIGNTRPLFLISGPCVIESQALVEHVAGTLVELTRRLGVP
jgi:2-dehydro-3-deoxyphosphooctonate aldolase (KDO 8-P synthase)